MLQNSEEEALRNTSLRLLFDKVVSEVNSDVFVSEVMNTLGTEESIYTFLKSLKHAQRLYDGPVGFKPPF